LKAQETAEFKPVRHNTQRAPLMILGFDAGDPRLLRRWAREGHLPTLASLMERGCWGQTSSPELMLEHGSWIAIFSGISRARHGFYYLRQLKPGSYNLQLVYGPDVNASPLWASWQDKHKFVVVADAPEVALQPGVPGLQITNWAVHRGYVSRAPVYQPSSEPADLLEEVTRKFGPPRQIIEDPDADPEQNRRMRSKLLARVERKGAVCRHLVERARADLVVACFGESHTAGHQFWRYCAEGSAQKQADANEFSHAMRDVYQAVDRQMGLLLAQMPPSTNVFILSSMGLADHYPTGGLMEAFCRQLGYQLQAEGGPTSFQPMALARRALPEKWRIALSRRLPRETREELFAQQFRTSTDWRRTTAFAIPSSYTGFLRVNLRGREPDGIVNRGREYDLLLERLEADLHQLIDPQTGQPAIEKVVRCGELYQCSPPEILPDLIVHWKACTHFMDRVMHPKAELTQEKPEFFRDSEHTDHGFFAAAGPAIQTRGQIADVDVLDLAPTFLALLGEPKPEQMTGQIIEELLRDKLQSEAC
jgi:predicted AlkP superfamily phosphohydrolase/phosphomutase